MVKQADLVFALYACGESFDLEQKRRDFDYPAEVWSTNTVHYERTYRFAGKTLTRIVLDPDARLVDVERRNNTWSAGPAVADR